MKRLSLFQILVFHGISTTPDVFPFKKRDDAEEFYESLLKTFKKRKDKTVLRNYKRIDLKKFPNASQYYFGAAA